MSINDDAQNIHIKAPHPLFGSYISHHPSDRFRLMIRSALLYAIPVVILQLLFWDVDTELAGFFLPLLFATTGLIVAWYLAHLWNREVVLYEKGFTYVEGSRIGHFLYQDIIQMHQKVERMAYLDIFYRSHYAYRLISSEEETLHINNIYSDTAKLIKRLESFITRDRLQIIEDRIQAGETIALGGGLSANEAGLEHGNRELFWHELGERRVQKNTLRIFTQGNDEWISIPIAELDNVILTLGIIKRQISRITQ